MNGTNYVSSTKIDESIFTDDNLSTITISDGKNTETMNDVVFIQQVLWSDGTYYLAFRVKSSQEKALAAISANSADLTDIQIALAEIYEAVIGG